ncbi:unnamed protein product [Polarella glacialis]|uniref:RING-type domain-containing protein n=1 Tax=Polarella glacialis TaxID=89957 RepID=A0A813KJS9_POLGL|nr:unnamed protein product [Polarella glacialis]
MDDSLREAQREKFLRHKQQVEENAASSSSSSTGPTAVSEAQSAAPVTVPSASAPVTGPASAPVTAEAQTSSAASSSGTTPSARRVHILPVGSSGVKDSRRLEVLAPTLRDLRVREEPIKTGRFINASGMEFVVVKSEPDESILVAETDYFVEGDPLRRFEKVQFICLWDFEHGRNGKDASALFDEYISPFFRSFADSGENVANIVAVGDVMKIFDLEFQVMAAEPAPPDLGIIDTNTMVFVDWDTTPEFSKIHIVPFQDTLPGAYQFDVFNDYLKPYLTRNKLLRFGVNDQFTYQGVQFKVVCCEPNGPARIGRNTTIYCEGVLHPSLRNLLPPELLQQLSDLPPGLQMLLMNTEALAGGYEERLMEVQEMLTRRRGMANETIDQIAQSRFVATGREDQQVTCMVCLCNFETDEEVRQLPCNHVFHCECIDEWLRRCTDCPICKTNVDRAVRHY